MHSTRNTPASDQVSVAKGDASPVLPKMVFAPPAPNAAPMSAPRPCCRITTTVIAAASSASTTISTVSNVLIAMYPKHAPRPQPGTWR